MPARDILHDIVKEALIKDGWVITHDPFVVAFGIRKVYVDFGTERLMAAEKGAEKLAIEVKRFLGICNCSGKARHSGKGPVR